MEGEYVVLSTSCRDLYPLIDLVTDVGKKLGFDISDKDKFFIKVHEDNAGMLTLGKLEPCHMTPRSKHYNQKYHWFHERLWQNQDIITLMKIDSKNQLGDIMTKGLTCVPFECLRNKIMGW